nr:Ig-like domain-containing protein [uncultured Duncaniella sp.]
MDTYYNFTRCWYRFTGHDLIPADKVTIQTESGNMANITLNPGETMKLSATMTPANASLPYIFWRSTNPAFATVDQDGNVTLVNRNEDDEIATYADNAATECKIIAETLYADGPVAEITIKDATSGIEDIIADEDVNDGSINRPNDIYNLQGICLKRNATDDDIKSLRPGFYIIGGKKVIVK